MASSAPKSPLGNRAAPAYAPPTSGRRLHAVVGTLAALLGAGGYLVARSTWSREPARGYTAFGLGAGIAAVALFVVVYAYSWRKRAGQEFLPGRLQSWLALHVWAGLLGAWAVLLHAGFHADDLWGTAALAVLGVLVVSGLIGWWLYANVPAQVADARTGVGNLALPHTEQGMRDMQRALESLEAGASAPLAERLRALRAGRPPPARAGNLDRAEQDVLTEGERLAARIAAEGRRARRQRSFKRWLRLWLWLHWPVAWLLPVAVAIHAWDALEVGTEDRPRAAREHLDPLSCAECHPMQVEEWLTSMHSMAMSSPTVDFQHRLLVAVEQAHVSAGGTAVAGDLCVKCHAPTGHHEGLTPRGEHEALLARVGERAPASAYGVSCAACHQIDSLSGHAAAQRLANVDTEASAVEPVDDLSRIAFRNIDNLLFLPGRTQRGPFGGGGVPLPVGNDEHRSVHAPAFGEPTFCASCHTVVVDRPSAALSHGTGAPVKLQNTFREWEEGGNAQVEPQALNWRAAGVTCLDCHARDLSAVAQAVRAMSDRRGGAFLPLEQRRERIVELLRTNAAGLLTGAASLAAQPPDGFDLPLPPRRRYTHAFTGVDHPLDDETPLLPGAFGLSPERRRARNLELRARMESNIQDLLGIAAAVEIDAVEAGRVKGRLLNLGTGHHLPAGFAFAREMWLEVTRVSDGRVLLGGDGSGRALGATSDLRADEKATKGFVNLQAVLWNGTEKPANDAYHAEGETVIQTEVPEVLAGKKARDRGFPDRHGPVLPGHTLAFELPCEVRAGEAVRVRLLFRNFPPKFLGDLERRLRATPGAEAPVTTEELARLARLRDGLRIREMARDER